MFKNLRNMTLVSVRTIKNFGHKREPVPLVTTIWHGALTFTFMGLVLKWDKIKNFIFGDLSESMIDDSNGPNDQT